MSPSTVYVPVMFLCLGSVFWMVVGSLLTRAPSARTLETFFPVRSGEGARARCADRGRVGKAPLEPFLEQMVKHQRLRWSQSTSMFPISCPERASHTSLGSNPWEFTRQNRPAL